MPRDQPGGRDSPPIPPEEGEAQGEAPFGPLLAHSLLLIAYSLLLIAKSQAFKRLETKN